MPNEQILPENYRKLVKSANLIGFLNRLAVFAYFGQKPIGQPLDSNVFHCCQITDASIAISGNFVSKARNLTDE